MGVGLHQKGYELWRAGLSPSEIRKKLNISKKTWEWLLKEGCDDLLSYESVLIDEVTALRSSASQIAIKMSTMSVEVLESRMANARKANQIIGRSLGAMMDVMDGKKDVDGLIEPKMLSVLISIANVSSVAEAFARIYGASPGLRALYPTADQPSKGDKSGPADPLGAVQGGGEDDLAGLPAEQRDDVMRAIGGWTPEQIEHYMKTGEEPPPQ